MKKLFILFVIVSVAKQSVAQRAKIDSLLVLLKTDKEDTNKVKHLNKILGQYISSSEYDKGLQYGNQALALLATIAGKAQQSHHNATYLAAQKSMAKSYNNMGVIYYYQGNYPEAIKMHLAALKLREELEDKKGIAASYNNVGLIYKEQGNYPEALKNCFASLKIDEELKNKQDISIDYNNIGIIYMSQGNYPEALKMHFASLKLKEETGDQNGIAYSYTNIGVVYDKLSNYSEALKNYFTALKIKEEIEEKAGIADLYTNIGVVYEKQGTYPKALTTYFAALKIQEEIGDKEGMATCFINFGQLYIKLLKIKEAQDYLNKALQLSKEIGSKDAIKETYEDMAVLDSLMGNYKAAFEHHKLYILYRDSLNNEETKKKSLQTSMQYEFDKKEFASKAEQDKLDAITTEEKKKQQIVIYAVAGLLVLVGVFAIFIYNRFRITNRQKVIIEKQKQKVDEAYNLLHEKNKEVMDSIHYAKRIQTALITSEKFITNSLNRLMKEN